MDEVVRMKLQAQEKLRIAIKDTHLHMDAQFMEHLLKPVSQTDSAKKYELMRRLGERTFPGRKKIAGVMAPVTHTFLAQRLEHVFVSLILPNSSQIAEIECIYNDEYICFNLNRSLPVHTNW